MATPTAHVIFLLDDSGSMGSYRDQTRMAFDGFVETLKKCKGAEIKLTLVKYGDAAVTIYKKKHIQDVGPLAYMPGNSHDMLFDALKAGIQIADSDKESSKKVIIMQCDGGDTGISMSSPEEIRDLITDRKAKGYEFTFMAAGERAALDYKYGRKWLENRYGCFSPVSIATGLGIPEGSIIQYAVSGNEGVIKAFSASAWNIGAFVSGRTDKVEFTESQRKAVKS